MHADEEPVRHEVRPPAVTGRGEAEEVLGERAQAMLFDAIEQATADEPDQEHPALLLPDTYDVEAMLTANTPTVAVLLTEARAERDAALQQMAALQAADSWDEILALSRSWLARR